MKPLGTKPMRHNFPSIDNLSWGKARLRGPHKAFYAMDYDLYANNGSKKASRQEAKREIEKEVLMMGGDA